MPNIMISSFSRRQLKATDDSSIDVINLEPHISNALKRLQSMSRSVTISRAISNKINRSESISEQVSSCEELAHDNVSGKIYFEEEFNDNENNSKPNVEHMSSSDVSEIKSRQSKNTIKSTQSSLDMQTGEKSKNRFVILKLNAPPVYVCMQCHAKFASYKLLKEHIATNRQCKMADLTCEICGKVYPKKKSMYQHLQSHREKKTYVCEQCGKVYTKQFNLENHIASQHTDCSDEQGHVYKCQLCSEQFLNRTDFFAHINNHSSLPTLLLCDTCGKRFTSAESLRSHIRGHLNIKPFVCSHCSKGFRTRLLLNQHLHIHTGIKLFRCELCDKAYAKWESLNIHKRKHSGIMPYQCKKCESRFDTLGKLKRHRELYHVTSETTPTPSTSAAPETADCGLLDQNTGAATGKLKQAVLTTL